MIYRSLITLSVSLCLEVWLSILLYRRRVSKMAPAFVTYIAAAVLVSLARFITLGHYSAYFFVYWASELLLILLSISALNHFLLPGLSQEKSFVELLKRRSRCYSFSSE